MIREHIHLFIYVLIRMHMFLYLYTSIDMHAHIYAYFYVKHSLEQVFIHLAQESHHLHDEQALHNAHTRSHYILQHLDWLNIFKKRRPRSGVHYVGPEPENSHFGRVSVSSLQARENQNQSDRTLMFSSRTYENSDRMLLSGNTGVLSSSPQQDPVTSHTITATSPTYSTTSIFNGNDDKCVVEGKKDAKYDTDKHYHTKTTTTPTTLIKPLINNNKSSKGEGRPDSEALHFNRTNNKLEINDDDHKSDIHDIHIKVILTNTHARKENIIYIQFIELLKKRYIIATRDLKGFFFQVSLILYDTDSIHILLCHL